VTKWTLFSLRDSVYKDTDKPAQAVSQRIELAADGAYCEERLTQTRFQRRVWARAL